MEVYLTSGRREEYLAQFRNTIDAYNSALGKGGIAQDLISFDSEDEQIEIVQNDMKDSILETETLSSRFYSVDSELFEVKFTRMRRNLKMIQIIWLAMVALSLILCVLQFSIKFSLRD